jgi:uncharacterized RDD family membrane protein YckC
MHTVSGAKSFIFVKGKVHGPYSEQELNAFRVKGHLTPDIPVWREGSQPPEIVQRALSASKPPALTTNAPRSNFQRVRQFQFAGFWLRAAASLIDGFIFLAITYLINLFLGKDSLASIAVQLLTNMLFEALFISTYSATPGKMLLGLKVLNMDMRPLTFMQALGRWFAKFLSGILFMIGYIMVAFTEKKQGLHDLICKTIVISKPVK